MSSEKRMGETTEEPRGGTMPSSHGGLRSVIEAERMAKPDLLPSPGFGAWLAERGGSLAFTTYQSSRVFLISADGSGGITVQERIVGSAMGLAATPDSLWIANKEQVWRFSNVGPLTYKDQSWDALYMPRKGYLLGGCDVHDIATLAEIGGTRYELVFINTAYSCLAAIDHHYGFRPLWKPDFISALSPEDRCHLNGLCVRDGRVTHVTLCGRFDTPYGWRTTKNGGGCVIDVKTNRIVCDGLSMPHSPRWHADRLWLLNSGCGDFGFVEDGRFVPMTLCPGFARGLCFVDRFAVIGLSHLRDNTFSSGMTIKERLEHAHILQRCGLVVVDPDNGRIIHWLTITGGISETFDVAFLPGITRPYTPGFSEPELHRHLMHVTPGIFPISSPRSTQPDPAPEAGANNEI